MAGYCSATLDQAPAHKCLCRRDQRHNSPHRCYCGHLWGDPFVEMSYDEQRAFLGLPRVKVVAGSYQLGKAYTDHILDELRKDTATVRETFGRPDWNTKSHQPQPRQPRTRDIYADLGKEIVIAQDGLSIGGRRFPGVIAKEGLSVEPISETHGLWKINLSLLTETPPRFIGTRLAESGEVLIDDEASGCEVRLRSGRWECVLEHDSHPDADLVKFLNDFESRPR
jgi:hypothetical protein